MRVKSCAASDGSDHLIQLSDEYGCVLRPKMISRLAMTRTYRYNCALKNYRLNN